MRHCEFKKRYDPKLGKYVKKRVYGEGISNFLKTVGSKIFGKTAKKAAETAAKKATMKTSEYAGKKAGDKIVELLNNNKTTPSVMIEPSLPKQQSLSEPKVLTTQEVNDRVNRLLSGGKLRRRNFI